MFRTSTSHRTLAIAVAVSVSALALASPTHADVTVKQTVVTTGMGGFGNGTVEATRVIAGDKCRNDQTYSGRGKPGKSTQIMRLDRDLMWSLDHAKKEYTELSFADIQAHAKEGMEQADAAMRKMQAEQKQADIEMDYKVDVQSTGKKETVNGYPAEEFIVTLTSTPKAKSADEQVPGFTIRMDEWLTEAIPGREELKAFEDRLGAKMGMDPELQRMGPGMASRYGDGLRAMGEKMKELKGYPVRTVMTTGMALPPGQQEQMEKAQAEAKAAMADAKKQQAAAEQAQGARDAEEAGSEAAHGDSRGAFTGLFAKKMAQAAEKKAQKKAQDAADMSAGGPGGVTVTMDVLSVTTGAATASFDLPAGYKKVTPKEWPSQK